MFSSFDTLAKLLFDKLTKPLFGNYWHIRCRVNILLTQLNSFHLVSVFLITSHKNRKSLAFISSLDC